MHTIPLYSLAKLREDEMRRVARRAYRFEPTPRRRRASRQQPQGPIA